MGEALTGGRARMFRELTHRDREPLQRVEEFVGVVGRRGGKSRAVSVLAAFIAGLCEHPSLVAGETGVLLVYSTGSRSRRALFSIIRGELPQFESVKSTDRKPHRTCSRAAQRHEIRVKASDFRRLRGPSYIAVIADESAFWFNEGSANPDSEILHAVQSRSRYNRWTAFHHQQSLLATRRTLVFV